VKDRREREWTREARSLRNIDVVPEPIARRRYAELIPRKGKSMGVDMDHVAARCARIGAVALLAAVLAFGICCESVAGAGEHNSSPSRQAAARSQRLEATPSASSQHQAELGSMRYYGGPKSPAWRAPAVN
jgi:hypothetical protein